MKKLLYPLAFALTAFLILYSCSAKKRTQPLLHKSNNQLLNLNQRSLNIPLAVTAGEGGTVSTEGGTFDEGTAVTV